MVPTTISTIDRIPLSANGKVDRRALVPPAARLDAETVAVSDRLTREIGELVAGMLKLPTVDPNRSLFELGATSLTMVSLQRLIANRLGRTIGLQQIFERPTVAGFAAEIAEPPFRHHAAHHLRRAPRGRRTAEAGADAGDLLAAVLPARDGRDDGRPGRHRLGAAARPRRERAGDRQHPRPGRLRGRAHAAGRPARAVHGRRPFLRRPRRDRGRAPAAARRRGRAAAAARRHGAHLCRLRRAADRRHGLHRHDARPL